MESLVESRWFAALLAIAVGCACGLLAKRIKVPAGYMIGAFVGVSALSISTGVAWLPTEVRTGVQIVAGAFVGCSLERSDLLRMRGSVRPLLLMLCTFLALNLVLGFAMSAVSSMDLRTALMCAVPGGINDTPIVAAAMGANGPDVIVMQLIRQVLGIGAFPIMIAAFDRALDRRGRPDPGTRDTAAADAKREKSKQRSATSTVVALAVAVAAGVLGRLSGVPGLTFAASIVAVSVLKLAFDFAYIPKWVKKACQLVAGVLPGHAAHGGGPRGTRRPHRPGDHPHRRLHGELLHHWEAGEQALRLRAQGGDAHRFPCGGLRHGPHHGGSARTERGCRHHAGSSRGCRDGALPPDSQYRLFRIGRLGHG